MSYVESVQTIHQIRRALEDDLAEVENVYLMVRDQIDARMEVEARTGHHDAEIARLMLLGAHLLRLHAQLRGRLG